MQLSSWGTQMSRLSGIRSIMEDIAAVHADGEQWLNLSPGNPALIPEVASAWRRMAAEAVEENHAESAGRYGPSRGTQNLVAAIVEYFNATYGWGIGPENVVVGPGSQMLCFIATTLFTGGDGPDVRPLVLPRVPDYTGYQGLSLTPDGIVGIGPVVDVEGPRRFSYRVDMEAVRATPSMGMMLVSNPANPTGNTLSREEMDGLVAIAVERDVPLVVDNAYGEPFPRVVDTPVPPTWHPNVINCFTLSKAGVPGERLGFAIGPADAVDSMIGFIANTHLHAPQLIQAVAERALSTREIDKLTGTFIAPYYQEKFRRAAEMLESRLPESVDWRLHSSEGGLFCWLWVDHDWFDDMEIYRRLKEKKVFIVPGRHFFVGMESSPAHDRLRTRCIRLSLSVDEDVIAEGVNRLAAAIGELHADRGTR